MRRELNWNDPQQPDFTSKKVCTFLFKAHNQHKEKGVALWLIYYKFYVAVIQGRVVEFGPGHVEFKHGRGTPDYEIFSNWNF